MNKEPLVKQIVIRVDSNSFRLIKEYANTEHRGLGDFVRHAALDYIENYDKRAPNSAYAE